MAVLLFPHLAMYWLVENDSLWLDACRSQLLNWFAADIRPQLKLPEIIRYFPDGYGPSGPLLVG